MGHWAGSGEEATHGGALEADDVAHPVATHRRMSGRASSSARQEAEQRRLKQVKQGSGSDARGRSTAMRTCRIWRNGRSAGTAELGADPRRRCLPAEGVAAGSEKLRERQAGGEERSRGSSTGPAGEVRRGEAAEPGGIRDGGSRRWRNSRAARLDDSGEEPREEDGGLDARRAAVGEPWGLGSAAPVHGVRVGLFGSCRSRRQER